MTYNELCDKIIDACVNQIDTSYCGPARFTVIIDDFDESDAATLIEIEGQFFEETGSVSFYDVRATVTDDEGNEIETEISRLIDQLDFYGEIENKVNSYICPEAFMAYDLEEQYC